MKREKETYLKYFSELNEEEIKEYAEEIQEPDADEDSQSCFAKNKSQMKLDY